MQTRRTVTLSQERAVNLRSSAVRFLQTEPLPLTFARMTVRAL